MMNSPYSSRPATDLSCVPPAPRKVHRRASLGSFFGPARLLTILLGLASIGMSVSGFCYALTMAYGTDVTGQILHHRVERHKNSYSHYPDYQYPIESGWRAGSDPFAPNESIWIGEGLPLTVRYLNVGLFVVSGIPQNPKTMMRTHGSLVFGAVAFAFMALGMGWHFYLLPYRYRHLLQNGEVVIGKIVERTARIIEKRRSLGRMNEPKEDPYGDQPTVYTLKYEFPLPGGVRRKSSMKVGMGDYGEVQCGDEVMVFYDPQRPRHSVIYPFVDDVIAGMEPQDEAFETAD